MTESKLKLCKQHLSQKLDVGTGIKYDTDTNDSDEYFKTVTVRISNVLYTVKIQYHLTDPLLQSATEKQLLRSITLS